MGTDATSSRTMCARDACADRTASPLGLIWHVRRDYDADCRAVARHASDLLEHSVHDIV
ncbi:hypothetical protein ABTX62_00295 [Streptomyces sp. NPDC096046]|uniref:hypothetical protein n=1 Tax=Streptomyces sp. NPDC096046 TaxID=3155542 RepID=UPI0033226E75